MQSDIHHHVTLISVGGPYMRKILDTTAVHMDQPDIIEGLVARGLRR